MEKTFMRVFIAIVMVLVLAACNSENANEGNNNQNNNNNGNGNISSISTDQSSKDYPHTQPVPTQEAKYEARKAPNQNQEDLPNGDQVPNTNNINARTPEQQEPQQNQQQPQAPQQAPQQATENHNLNQFEQDVVALTNNERRQAGLSELKIDPALSQVAREKSNDMHKNNYFSHTSPTYGSPFDMMRDFGITYQSAGENIAAGQTSPEEVVQAWMNSQGHRENILNPDFTHIGVGYESQGRNWTQMFIKR